MSPYRTPGQRPLYEEPKQDAPIPQEDPEPHAGARFRTSCKAWKDDPIATQGHRPFTHPCQLDENDVPGGCSKWHCPHCLGHVRFPVVRHMRDEVRKASPQLNFWIKFALRVGAWLLLFWAVDFPQCLRR